MSDNCRDRFGAAMPGDPGRQRRDHGLPVRREPALATIADHVGANDHVLDQEILIALEARAGRHRDLHDPILVHAQIGSAAPAAAPLAPTLLRRRVPARLLPPARLDRWGPLRPLRRASSSRNAATVCSSPAIRSISVTTILFRSAGDKWSRSTRGNIPRLSQTFASLGTPRPPFCPSYVVSLQVCTTSRRIPVPAWPSVTQRSSSALLSK